MQYSVDTFQHGRARYIRLHTRQLQFTVIAPVDCLQRAHIKAFRHTRHGAPCGVETSNNKRALFTDVVVQQVIAPSQLKRTGYIRCALAEEIR